jgi:hypothetical protein
VRLIDGGQQLHIGPAVAASKAVPLVGGRLHPPARLVMGDQARDLGAAQPGHLLDVAVNKTSVGLAQTCILLSHQKLLDPGVTLLSVPALKMNLFAALQKAANRLQTYSFGLVHADVQSPA